MKCFVAVMLATFLSAPIGAKRPRNDASCIMDTDAYCTEEFVRVELSNDQPEVSVRLNVAVGDGVSISLPPGLDISKESLVVGNSELFSVQALPGAVTVHPRLSKEAMPRLIELARQQGKSPEQMLLGESGNLQLRDEPWFVNIDLRIARKAHAVQFLRVLSDDLAREESRIEADCAARLKVDWDKVRAEKAQLEQRRVEHDAQAVAFQTMFEGQCRSWWWTEMHDLLWVEVHRVCEIGDRLIVSFTIRNEDGSGRIFRPGRIELLAGDDEGSPVEPSGVVWAESLNSKRQIQAESIVLSEDQSVVGAIHVERKRARAGRLNLHVVERGETRKVLVEGIGF